MNDKYLGVDSDLATLSVCGGNARQNIILPSQPRRQGRRTVMNGHILPGSLGIPYPGRPGPSQATISNAWWRPCEFPMKGSELPLSVTCFLGFDVPDVVSFRLRLLPIFIETKNVLLSPKIVPNLMQSKSLGYGRKMTFTSGRTFFIGIFSSGYPCLASLIEVEPRFLQVMDREVYLFQKSQSKRLNTKFEWPEVRRLV